MKELVLRTNKNWRGIKAEAKRPLSVFFCYFSYSTVVRFSVFVLITTNLMARGREKEKKKEKKKYS